MWPALCPIISHLCSGGASFGEDDEGRCCLQSTLKLRAPDILNLWAYFECSGRIRVWKWRWVDASREGSGVVGACDRNYCEHFEGTLQGALQATPIPQVSTRTPRFPILMNGVAFKRISIAVWRTCRWRILLALAVTGAAVIMFRHFFHIAVCIVCKE